MSETTKIEWATSTGNPWIGCTKISPGCKNCYAETLDRQRFSRTIGGGTKEKPVSHWGPGAPRFRTKGFWQDALRWNNADEWLCPKCGQRYGFNGKSSAPACLKPECLCGLHRPRIFPSLCDWLDEEVPIEWLADFLKLIYDTPNLDWLLLTKRPENWNSRLWHVLNGGVPQSMHEWLYFWVDGRIAPANVWIGTSVEDQQRADKRIPELLKIPANVRFLSVEPMLDPVDLDPWIRVPINRRLAATLPPLPGFEKIDWVIVGGESGPGARPCKVEWVRSIVSQCRDAGVPCFVKQLGSNPSFEHTNLNPLKHTKGGDMNEWPEDCRVRQFPKLASGSLL